MVKPRTYYDLLGLPFGASPDEVKVRYRELAKRYHPDVNPSPEAARLMQEINEAYRVLTDPRLRLAYHLRLAAYAMRRAQKRAVAPIPHSPPPPKVAPVSYPLRILVFLFSIVLASSAGYHWLHPFAPSQAR
ncbi:MAG: DnaJ domain-containing protein [Bacteroidia bacterium]|nr:DnaJ domain-containing protein [Bacteroidia bacterium]